MAADPAALRSAVPAASRVPYAFARAHGVTPDAVRRAITKDTILVSIMAANNETGVIFPVDELARIANDGMADMVRRWPDKFPAFVASLPMNNVPAALEEMDRAIGTLGAQVGATDTGRVILFAVLVAIIALLISILPAAWMVLPVQLLHGLTFSLTWAAGVSYARQISPAGMSATAQGLFSGIFFGLGGSVGALMGGILYQAVGSALMFRYVAVAILAAALFFLWMGRSSRSAASSPSE